MWVGPHSHKCPLNERGRQKGQSQIRRCEKKKKAEFGVMYFLILEMEWKDEPRHRVASRTERKKMDSPLKPLVEIQPCRHIDFS